MPRGIYVRREETKRKISEALKGRILSEEWKRKISAAKKKKSTISRTEYIRGYRKTEGYKKSYRKSKKRIEEYSKRYRQTEKYKGYLERPNVKLSRILRHRFREALRKNTKSGSAVRDLGCSIEEFKFFMESKFQEGMTWNNHGRYGWHIDHIIPLSSFDLTNREQLLKACHYTNLQPLWAKDNLSKNNKII